MAPGPITEKLTGSCPPQLPAPPALAAPVALLRVLAAALPPPALGAPARLPCLLTSVDAPPVASTTKLKTGCPAPALAPCTICCGLTGGAPQRAHSASSTATARMELARPGAAGPQARGGGAGPWVARQAAPSFHMRGWISLR